MNIQDALKETGMAILPHCGWHVRLLEGSVKAYMNDSLDSMLPEEVSLYQIFRDVWQPYHPEPKCPACIEVEDERKLLRGQELPYGKNDSWWYLEHYHCTCSKED